MNSLQSEELCFFTEEYAVSLPGVWILGRLLFADAVHFLNYVVSEILELGQTNALVYEPSKRQTICNLKRAEEVQHY